jgi:hypothetical protein
MTRRAADEGAGGLSAGFRTPPPLTSAELRDAAVVVGTATHLGDETVEPGAAPGFGSVALRRFRVGDVRVLRAGSTPVDAGGFAFEGFTTLAPPFAPRDPLAPTLRLEGQRFFDEQLPAGPFPVLLLVGGPPISPPAGFGGRRASVSDGVVAGAPVRPFLLAGADAGLPEAVGALAGWAAGTVEAAAAAPHPLVALDALRIASGPPPDAARVQTLARRLLHPATPQEARSSTLELVGRVLQALPAGSPGANALVELTAWTWRLERRHAPETAYLELWAGAAEQVRASGVAKEVRAMALDRTAVDQRDALRGRLGGLLPDEEGTR